MLSTNSKHVSCDRKTQYAARIRELSARGRRVNSREIFATKSRAVAHAFPSTVCATPSARAILTASIFLRAAHAKTSA